MSRPTSRVLTLLELLQSGGTRTVAELADRLGVDGRTVRRYVNHLIDLDVPVESVRGRYGGYRLAPGYRLPPLMFTDDEALAVLLGLVAGPRAGTTTALTARETASAKLRRVLPGHIARRLEALLDTLAVTHRADGTADTPDGDILLTLADAAHHHRPVAIRYTDRAGRLSERRLHPYGIVAHAGHWYVTGVDARIGEDRTFRLDRIADARALPGSFEAPVGLDPAERVLSGFAAAEYRHEVSLRIHGTVGQIRAHLPAGIANLEECGPVPAGNRVAGRRGAGEQGAGEVVAGDPSAKERTGEDGSGERWLRVTLRAERLDWLPAVLAALDRPFVVERPDELRGLVTALADRLASSARRV
ncbi:helix-turn-helix transcriptional regulator [Myceligenerans indicum]|uniref:Transcriptional regulator n=1 Tax=Myceligenerans indicum TaxID=2593663 RepID=A0ABS1LGG9_9MICO|nr:transcriptional regulator [Myceligenerans indicum]MBL0885238.1 transcriptional regulator [Myceligenerans indicum]